MLSFQTEENKNELKTSLMTFTVNKPEISLKDLKR